MGKKIRLLVTMACHRDCPYCCNKYERFKKMMEVVTFTELDEYDEIIITGGEPLLPHQINNTYSLIKNIRKYFPDKKIYLYTTVWSKTWLFEEIMRSVDGIHYTLHEPLMVNDIHNLELFQESIEKCGEGKSFRLYVDPQINQHICFNPHLFVRVESKPWLMEHEVPFVEDKLALINI